jgi:hypothetical protein
MRVVSGRAFEMILSGGSWGRVRSDVRLAVVDVCEVPLRHMTMERMSISIPGHYWRDCEGVYFLRMT